MCRHIVGGGGSTLPSESALLEPRAESGYDPDRSSAQHLEEFGSGEDLPHNPLVDPPHLSQNTRVGLSDDLPLGHPLPAGKRKASGVQATDLREGNMDQAYDLDGPRTESGSLTSERDVVDELRLTEAATQHRGKRTDRLHRNQHELVADAAGVVFET